MLFDLVAHLYADHLEIMVITMWLMTMGLTAFMVEWNTIHERPMMGGVLMGIGGGIASGLVWPITWTAVACWVLWSIVAGVRDDVIHGRV